MGLTRYKTAATASEIYYRSPIWWRLALEKVETIRVPNFAKMSQSTADILLLPVPRNKRPPSWKSTSTFHLDYFAIIGMWLCVGLPNFICMRRSVTELWRHIDFSKNGLGVGNLLPVSCLVTSRTWEDQKLTVYQMLPKYLNPWLKYYYFRFMKSNPAILKLYIWFPFWCFHRDWNVILNWVTKF